jgi:soluble cytochrome b562
MRDDVQKFAEQMSAAMDSKQVERETRNDPHYMSPEYQLRHAFDCLKDKIEQLESHTERGNKERTVKTAVHMANFCMIIAAKVEADQKL